LPLLFFRFIIMGMVRWRSISLLAILLFGATAFAGIVDDVRQALAQDNFSAAESELNSYKAKQGTSPEYLEALSWMARAALSKQQYDQAERYAKQTQTLALGQLKTRKLDAEEHLPIALGAAFEVQGQALAAQGHKAQAVSLLKSALHSYGNTSIEARLQKNLNVLTLTGQPAPALKATEHLGPASPSLAQMKGSPVLLFFWAHWCVDCKGESPILARLRSEYGPRGLMIVAPTQRYGYAARGEDASPQAELQYMQSVWQQYYAGLGGVPVPVSKANFNLYGASTTPTLVLVDRAGKIAFYHPGALPYDELRAAIDRVMQ
jgi:thiol-disulfide isomerase/thioredoxin